MKLIVGLGNPGKDYQKTRHNIGFLLIDYVAKKYDLEFNKEKFGALYTETIINGEKVLFIKPLSFMNLSGTVVRKYFDFYKLDVKDILVFQDDLDMNFGRVKFVYNSSSGGHNGIKDIEKNLGSKEYARLKIGVSHDRTIDTKDYVLGSFSTEEIEKLNLIFDNLKDIVWDFCNSDFDKIMNKYNRKN